MKKILLTIIFIAPVYLGICQTKDTVHLSYNLYEEQCDIKKVYHLNNKVHFYINDQHFKTILGKNNVLEISSSDLKEIKLINISEFLNFANKKRKRLIKEGEKSKSIKILFNDQVFDRIYIYMRDKNNTIKKYIVTWIEEIK